MKLKYSMNLSVLKWKIFYLLLYSKIIIKASVIRLTWLLKKKHVVVTRNFKILPTIFIQTPTAHTQHTNVFPSFIFLLFNNFFSQLLSMERLQLSLINLHNRCIIKNTLLKRKFLCFYFVWITKTYYRIYRLELMYRKGKNQNRKLNDIKIKEENFKAFTLNKFSNFYLLLFIRSLELLD